MRLIFEHAGYRVSEAGTLADATGTAREAMPDVILLDLTLPDGDGLDLLPTLERRSASRPVIIALTGRDEDAIRRRCRALGCHHLVVKPAAPRELVELVGTLLG